MAATPLTSRLRGEAEHESGPVNDFESILGGLRAAGESTRLRILAVLNQGELTVSELCRILGQTQPRVSRHLRLLCEAGLLVRHSEGTNAFYSISQSEPGRSITRSVLSLVHHDDDVLDHDRARLAGVWEERAAAADHYFEQVAERWHQLRSLHVAEGDVESALLQAVAAHHPDQQDGRELRLIDIGTGTGRILELLADRINYGLGIDLSVGMLNVARSNLKAKGLEHCTVRHGNIYALDIQSIDAPRDGFDLAVVHHVLHFLDDPAAALAETAATLRPGGLLIVVDFAPHHLEHLRSDHRHRSLGFSDEQVATWCQQLGMTDITVTHLVPEPAADQRELVTVTLWTAVQSEPVAN